MNRYFSRYPKGERESQQILAWENNRSSHSNESEYFITDIEYAESGGHGRSDMLGVRWLAEDRKRGLQCRPVVIEMKNGNGAYTGKSGIVKHIEDLRKSFASEEVVARLRETVGLQFDQLSQLGLIRFNRSRGSCPLAWCSSMATVMVGRA